MIRCDSAAMAPKTSYLLPDPETPVKTVRRRFGRSTSTFLGLLTRPPCTRIRSWRSATVSMGINLDRSGPDEDAILPVPYGLQMGAGVHSDGARPGAVRLRIGVLLWALSWIPYGLLLGLSGLWLTVSL